MSDIAYIAITIGFFALAIAYARGCESFAERTMTDTLWLSVVTLMVLVYLLYALLMPEKF